ncbi:MAG: FkbM family methyltransferase [Pseudomonadota bacterium]
MTWPAGTAQAIARSLDIYYRDRARTARMDRLNAQFVRQGALAFDIGAHLGDRTASFRRLGARVVAVEPQPAIFRALRLIHGRDPGVSLHATAIGAAPGRTTLYLNTANPTVSTAERALVDAAQAADGWSDQVWDRAIETPVVTLDHLIGQHGTPDFVKIDVEGFEAAALRGLSHPVPALSFEFTTLQRAVAVDALHVLGALGSHTCNYSLGETHTLALPDWITPDAMAAQVSALPEAANSGDIYARRVG